MSEPLAIGANVEIVEDFETLEQAVTRCATINGVSGGATIPMIHFRQGNRSFLQGVLPVAYITTQLKARPASKRASIAEAEKAVNRPLLDDHVSAIKNYLLENAAGTYIMPGVSVNIHTTRPLRFYTTASNELIRFGYLFLPQSATFTITDGQHRVAGATDAIEEMEESLRDHFGEDGIPVMISLEGDVRQAHQDFADCSRVRPLPPALLATYDRRNPGNRIFLDLVEECSIFRNHIETTSKTIVKNSPNLFTANQVKSYVKALLLHSWSGSVEQYEEDVRQLISDPDQQAAKLQQMIEFTKALTDEIPAWREISSIPDDKRSKIIDIRAQKFVCLEGEGLVILGCLGNELLTYAPDQWRHFVRRLGAINWQESDPIWTSSIRQRNDRIDQKTGTISKPYRKISAYNAVQMALENVRRAISWTKPQPIVEPAGGIEDAADGLA
jgi:DNA sulfur modification protein DndB